MSLTVAMVQSSYIPWKGYFDMVLSADRFVFYDDVQFTKEDWRNRNLIKTKDGPLWLTVPCGAPQGRRICDVTIASSRWQRKHWEAIRHAYAGTTGLKRWGGLFEELYTGKTWTSLSELNQTFIRRIAGETLSAETEFDDSRDYPVDPGLAREDRWIAMLAKMGATRFLIGPKARDYLDAAGERKVADAGVELVWMDYGRYREYEQRFPPFEHKVSVLDLIFHEPDRARELILEKTA